MYKEEWLICTTLRMSDLIQVNETNEMKKRPKITLVEVVRKKWLLEITENIILNMIKG